MNRSRVIRGWLGIGYLNGTDRQTRLHAEKIRTRGQWNIPCMVQRPDQEQDISTTFTTSELGLILIYQPKAVYVVDGMRRFPVNFNKYPVFSFQYFKGYEDIFGGDYDYEKFIFGYFPALQYGRTWEALNMTSPLQRYPDSFHGLSLSLLRETNRLFLTSRTYNLMNYGEFVLDEALELFCILSHERH